MKKRIAVKSHFSLIEMLVVMAVMAILLSFLSAKFVRLSQASQAQQCKSQLKTLYMATELYINDNNNFLPGPLYSGQTPNLASNQLGGYLSTYIESIRRSDNKINILPQLVCPSNHLESSTFQDDMRLHFITHIGKNSSSYFGYPGKSKSQNANVIESPSDFMFLRDLAKPEFKNYTGTLPGWYDLLADLSPHYGTEVNTLYFDGRIGQDTFLP